MAIKKKHKDLLSKDTRVAASAFLEDMDLFRSILKNPNPSGVRRASVQLRRLVVNEEIAAIAAPRMPGKLHLEAMDNSSFTKKGDNIAFFTTGGFDLFGVGVPPPFVCHYAPNAPQMGLDPNTRVLLNVDQFKKQKITCLNGTWITRGEIIKYAAINTGVAHTEAPRDNTEKTIERIRHGAVYSILDGKRHFSLNLDAINPNKDQLEFDFSKKTFDSIIIELLSTISFIVTSTDIVVLENIVSQELGVR